MPVIKPLPDGNLQYGGIDQNGVVKGPVFKPGQDPEDGPIGYSSNVPYSQFDEDW